MGFIADIRQKKKFKKISYSQCGEDLLIQFIFDQLKIKNPSYLDIGAHHPFYLSNTALMYENGSTGVNIEPDPDLFKNFLKHRRKDKNLNIGIGESEGFANFYHISTPTLNTFSKHEAENYINEGDYRITRLSNIEVNTLKKVIQHYCANKFADFLNIDAEGIDELIIKSIDFSDNYPIVICIETISFSTSGRGVKNAELIKRICNEGYILYADTYINSIFVRDNVWKDQ